MILNFGNKNRLKKVKELKKVNLVSNPHGRAMKYTSKVRTENRNGKNHLTEESL